MKGSSNDAQVKHVFIRGTFNRASPGNVTVTVSSFTCIFAVPGQVRELHSQNLHVIFGLYADGCSWRGSASLGWQFLVAVGSSRTMPYCNLELLGQFVTKQVEAGCSIAPVQTSPVIPMGFNKSGLFLAKSAVFYISV